MRVLMTTDTVGGVWSYALELARALEQSGTEIALATMGAPLTDSQQAAVRSLHRTRVFESDYKLEWMEDPWEDVARAGEWLSTIERRFRPDLIHLNSYVHGALPWRAPVLMVGHSCVLSWWQAVRGAEAPAEWARYRAEVTQGLRSAQMVVAPTRAMLASLQHYYGPLRQARVIANARDGGQFRPRAKEPLIFASGRLWDEAKNLSLLESVADRLRWPVYLAGNSESPDGRKRDFGNMTHLGVLSQAEMAEWFGRAAIYVHPARYEPFGLAVLEAALSGCALVLGDIPTLRELWEGRALFVSPDDAGALRRAVESLAGDPQRRQELAAGAARQALQFDPATFARGYQAAYERLVSERRPAAGRLPMLRRAPRPQLPVMPSLQPES